MFVSINICSLDVLHFLSTKSNFCITFVLLFVVFFLFIAKIPAFYLSKYRFYEIAK